MIPVYIVSGLLDSGKTSFIKSTLLQQDWLNKGHTLVLLCETGEVEFTEEEKRGHDLIPIEIPEAETLSLSFMEDLSRSSDPAQIIIEFNGMWSLQDFLKKDFPKNWGLAGVYSTVNGEDLELVMTNMRNLFMNQHIESDLIVVNRCRPDMNRATFRKAIKLQNPGAQMIFEAESGEIIEFGEDDLPYDIKAPAFTLDDADYGTWFADASENPERYVHKKITFLAQFFRPFGMARSMFVPGRRVMACCAADIQFYGFPCKSDKPVSFVNKGWYNVTVEFTAEKKKDRRTGNPVLAPVLRYISSEEAEAPEEEVVTL
ncbi:MAG: hypothetical protein IJK86_09945 [Lachnospiraceae bacterium]|nr:hypothetical protein [Lachnospiraceae bacterium]